MTQPGYQAGSESLWWWKVAQHLDEAQRSLSNAMAHNVDDPRPVQALYTRLREGQAILFDVFRLKGLLPAAPPAPPASSAPMSDMSASGPMSGMPMAGMPGMPMPPGAPPGVPWFGGPGSDGGTRPPPYFVEQGAPHAYYDHTVPPAEHPADHAAAASETARPIAPTSNGVPPAAITPESPATAVPVGPSTEGVGG